MAGTELRADIPMPSWEEALATMRRFLAQEGHPSRLSWVFRDDLFLTRPNRAYVRSSGLRDNQRLAAKVFEESRAKGLVEISAVAETTAEGFATVWYPREPEDEIQGWSEGMKLSIRLPLAKARLVRGSSLWFLARLLPAYQRFQTHAFCIGTSAWAAAASHSRTD